MSSRADEIRERRQKAAEAEERRGYNHPIEKPSWADIDYLLAQLKDGGAEDAETGGFHCDCCGRDMEVRVNGKFCNECAGYRANTAPTENSTDYRQRNHEALNRFRGFGPNWDSYNSLPINPRTIEIAERLIPVLPEWQVVPRSDGGIQFDGPDGAEIQIEVEATESNERCDVSVTGKHRIDPPYCKDCGKEFVFSATEQAGEQQPRSNLEPHPFQEHPHYPDYCAFAVGNEDYCKRGTDHSIHIKDSN